LFREDDSQYQADLIAAVAYQQVNYDEGDSDVSAIHPLQWPNGNEYKVPSEISYVAAPGRHDQWGFDIAPGATKMVWTKLELEKREMAEELQSILDALDGMKGLDGQQIDAEFGLPSYPAKSPTEIVADFLERVREHVPTEIRPEILGLPIDLVVTAPAVRCAKLI
jgi:hypothetical protein